MVQAAVGESDRRYWETIWNSKCSPDSAPFDKRLRLLAVSVIKQNGILWKPFLWCHRHLSKTQDVYEGERVWQLWHFTKSHSRLRLQLYLLKPLRKFPFSYIHSAISWQRTLSTCHLTHRLLWQTYCLLCARVFWATSARKANIISLSGYLDIQDRM